jgi:hypothetical protein
MVIGLGRGMRVKEMVRRRQVSAPGDNRDALSNRDTTGDVRRLAIGDRAVDGSWFAARNRKERLKKNNCT